MNGPREVRLFLETIAPAPETTEVRCHIQRFTGALYRGTITLMEALAMYDVILKVIEDYEQYEQAEKETPHDTNQIRDNL